MLLWRPGLESSLRRGEAPDGEGTVPIFDHR